MAIPQCARLSGTDGRITTTGWGVGLLFAGRPPLSTLMMACCGFLHGMALDGAATSCRAGTPLPFFSCHGQAILPTSRTWWLGDSRGSLHLILVRVCLELTCWALLRGGNTSKSSRPATPFAVLQIARLFPAPVLGMFTPSAAVRPRSTSPARCPQYDLAGLPCSGPCSGLNRISKSLVEGAGGIR